MTVLSLDNVVKRYHNHTACDHITFDIKKGSVFGLLGPNGAGKTSLIRIITTITAADEGTVKINGENLNSTHIRNIGYMPEERGLYKKMKVGEQLMYLAQLKGMSKQEARAAIKHWMEKFEITDWYKKMVEELSKGMQQKIQFISTVMHDPDLLILDEPFSGLDPINTNLIKDEISALNAKGTSIIFSTHRMEQVEEICQEIVLVNQGKVILNGVVQDIKDEYKQNIYEFVLAAGQASPDFSGYNVLSTEGQRYRLQLTDTQNPNEVLKTLISGGFQIKEFQEVLPSLNDIFIRTVENQSA